jgi:hypothetical protein
MPNSSDAQQPTQSTATRSATARPGYTAMPTAGSPSSCNATGPPSLTAAPTGCRPRLPGSGRSCACMNQTRPCSTADTSFRRSAGSAEPPDARASQLVRAPKRSLAGSHAAVPGVSSMSGSARCVRRGESTRRRRSVGWGGCRLRDRGAGASGHGAGGAVVGVPMAITRWSTACASKE